MTLPIDHKNIDKLIVVGDRVLIKPRNPDERTKSGLLLPPGVQEKQKVQFGYVLKVGPGYPIPAIADYDEPWQKRSNDRRYFPLQAEPGDLAVYLLDSSYEIEFDGTKYIIVPFNAILLLLRDGSLFE